MKQIYRQTSHTPQYADKPLRHVHEIADNCHLRPSLGSGNNPAEQEFIRE